MSSAVDRDNTEAWLVCLGASIAFFMSSGMVKALAILLPALRQQFATQTWNIGVTISLLPGFGGVACPIGSALTKRFSGRITVCIFSVIASLAVILGSFATTVPILSACFTLSALVVGAEAVLAGELAKYFTSNYDIANAIARSGLSAGIIVMPLLTQFLFDVYGWRGTLLLLGTLNLHSVVAGVLLRPISDETQNAAKDVITDINEDHQRFSGSIAYYFDLKLFTNPILLTRIVYSMGSAYSWVGWMIYLVPFAIDEGTSPYRAATLSTVGGIGNLLGNITFPLLKKKLPNAHILYVTTLVSGLSLVACPLFSSFGSYTGLVVSSMTIGWSRSLGILAGQQITKECFDEDEMTSAFSWLFVAFSLGSIGGGFLSGWIYDQTGSFSLSFLLLGIVSLLSVAPQPFVDNQQKRTNSQYSPVSAKE